MQDVLQYLTSATLGHPLRSSLFQIFNAKDFLLRSVDRNWDRSARHGVGKTSERQKETQPDNLKISPPKAYEIS